MLIVRCLSFKERGARYALSQLTSEYNGVIAVSHGNYGLALSYHGQILGIPVHVVLPKHAPVCKIEKCAKHKANIVLEGNTLMEAKQHALKIGKEKNLLFLNGYIYFESKFFVIIFNFILFFRLMV